MSWQVDCGNPMCLQISWASNIVELITTFCDEDGMIMCPHCFKQTGYVRKNFVLQEEGETWEPILRGIVRLAKPEDSYQPFVFLASYAPEQEQGAPPVSIIECPITELWFSYYKDLRGQVREDGKPGRLKMGYGPGGPPVINLSQLIDLVRHILRIKMLPVSDVHSLLES